MFQESRNNHRKRRLYVPYLPYYYYKPTHIVKVMMKHGHQQAVLVFKPLCTFDNKMTEVFSFCVLNSRITKSST